MGPPIASIVFNIKPGSDRDIGDLHATTVAAEVKRGVTIAPDVLLSLCVRLGFDLDFVGGVVTPCRAVSSANAALTDVNVLRKSGDYKFDVAAMADRVYQSVLVCRCHLSSVVQAEVRKLIVW